MTQDPNNVHIWAGAEVYYAPTGTAAPTDPEAIPAAWLDLGVILPETGEQTIEVDAQTFQGRVKSGTIPVASTSNITTRKLSIAVMEDNPNIQALIEPETTTATVGDVSTITHVQSSFDRRYALCAVAWSGEIYRMRTYAAAQPVPTSLKNLFGSEPGNDVIEWEIFPDGDGEYGQTVTNDPAFAVEAP